MILSYFSSLEESEKNKGNIYSQKMNKVINYINENLAEPLMIEDICKHFHYSKSYIVKEFKASLGVPIKQYIIAKKILLAESLISKGSKPTEIYNNCGFEDYSTFYRNYIKIVGKAPSLGGALTIPSSDIETN
jgi:AraC-like DNA-binding protein